MAPYIALSDDEWEELDRWSAEQERKRAAPAKKKVKKTVKNPKTTKPNGSAESIDSSNVIDGKRKRQPPIRYAPEKHIPKKRTKKN